MNVDCNFVAAESWDDGMPERLRWIRDNDPVYWSEQTKLWMVTSYADAEYVSKNQDLFTSGEGVRPQTDIIIGLIDEPEPRHQQLRNLINRGFSPRMVKKLEEIFRRITADAIDEVAKQGECDFVDSISVPLPVRLIAEMIGIRQEDRDRFHRWSDDLIASDGNQDKPEIMAKAGKAFIEYSQYVTAIIEDRRKEPKDDLVSILTGADSEGLLKKDFHDDDRGMTRAERQRLAAERGTEAFAAVANDELIILLVVLMVAGNETTRNGISGGMQLLIENPDERQKLIDDPSLIPSAVEEMVRLVSPVRTFGRTVTRDAELGGKKLKKGDWVCMAYGPANRDPKAFDDPDTFRVDRNPIHLGFGIGSHFCLGANLARMEMRVAFEEVLRRLPDMSYSRGGPEFRPSSLVRSCTHMWVQYTPEDAPASGRASSNGLG